MFIQTENTPNPKTKKFLPGCLISPEKPVEFTDLKQATAGSDLAASLFSLPEVTSVFLGYDFISVTQVDSEWTYITPIILGLIMDYLTHNMPILKKSSTIDLNSSSIEFFDPSDSETVKTIKELLDLRVRPVVAQDGGDITFKGYKDGVVYLHMRGACAGCPSSTATLKNGIENLLKHFIPDILAVEAVS